MHQNRNGDAEEAADRQGNKDREQRKGEGNVLRADLPRFGSQPQRLTHLREIIGN